MLTQAERQEIEAELEHFPRKSNGCIDALKIVQRHRQGWVSDEAVRDIAAFLEMTPDAVDSVATFYNLVFRRPVGRHKIFVCDSVSCWIMGYEKVRQRLTEHLGVDFGQTTHDDQFTLLPIQCLGTCDHAPAMMIDEDLYRDLTHEKIDGILQEYKKE